MWVFILTLAGLPLVLLETLNRHSETEALQQAESIQTVISAVRTYYTKNVVRKALTNGGAVVVTENYHNLAGGIPIPATLSIELGEAIRQEKADQNYTFQFVSDMPFRNRVRAPLDQFEIDALRAFRKPGETSTAAVPDRYWRLEKNDDGRSFIRLAVPVRMEAGCVSCHNSHPDSPLKTWKVGDIRGIQSVSIGMQVSEQLSLSQGLAGYLVLLAITGALAIREHKTGMARLKQLNHEMDASRQELQDKSEVLQRSVRELRTKTTILDRAPFGILVLDTRDDKAGLEYANDAFAQTTGYTSEQVLGRHPRFLFGPDTDAVAAETINQALQQHTIADVEILNYRRDGSKRVMRWLVFPSFSQEGALLNMVVCMNDVTDIRDAEAERSRLIGELQESTKLEFLGLTIAGMAHDLNTPIGIAVTASSHIQQVTNHMAAELQKPDTTKDQVVSLNARIQRSAEMIVKNLAKAAELVKGFKRTSADVARNEWRNVNVSSIINSLVLTMSPVMKRANCEVEVSCPHRVTLYTEPGALSQAITNLMVNATLHAFPDRVDRRLRLEVRDLEEVVEVVVADNGVGMSEEAAVKAFTPFFTTKRGAGGSGLGLFSSRRAIENVLGGKLTMTTEAGRGTSFLIRLKKTHPDGTGAAVDTDWGTTL